VKGLTHNHKGLAHNHKGLGHNHKGLAHNHKGLTHNHKGLTGLALIASAASPIGQGLLRLSGAEAASPY